MATLTVASTPARTGIDFVTSAVSADVAGDKFDNAAGNSFVYFLNSDSVSKTVTLPFKSTVTVDGVDPVDKTFTVTAGHNLLLGPFSPSLYNDANDLVNLTYSAVTSCKVLAFHTV